MTNPQTNKHTHTHKQTNTQTKPTTDTTENNTASATLAVIRDVRSLPAWALLQQLPLLHQTAPPNNGDNQICGIQKGKIYTG